MERESLRKQENLTNDIIKHGMWQTENEIDNMLASYIKASEKIDVLKIQLKFRKEVLLQAPTDKKIFNVTKAVDGKRTSLSVECPTTNLKSLIRQAIVNDQENDTNMHMLEGRRVRHRFEENQKIETWYTGKIISQVLKI